MDLKKLYEYKEFIDSTQDTVYWRALTLIREEQILVVLKNNILSRIFGHTKYENEEWGKFQNEEPNNFYFSPNVVWMVK